MEWINGPAIALPDMRGRLHFTIGENGEILPRRFRYQPQVTPARRDAGTQEAPEVFEIPGSGDHQVGTAFCRIAAQVTAMAFGTEGRRDVPACCIVETEVARRPLFCRCDQRRCERWEPSPSSKSPRRTAMRACMLGDPPCIDDPPTGTERRWASTAANSASVIVLKDAEGMPHKPRPSCALTPCRIACASPASEVLAAIWVRFGA